MPQRSPLTLVEANVAFPTFSLADAGHNVFAKVTFVGLGPAHNCYRVNHAATVSRKCKAGWEVNAVAADLSEPVGDGLFVIDTGKQVAAGRIIRQTPTRVIARDARNRERTFRRSAIRFVGKVIHFVQPC